MSDSDDDAPKWASAMGGAAGAGPKGSFLEFCNMINFFLTLAFLIKNFASVCLLIFAFRLFSARIFSQFGFK